MQNTVNTGKCDKNIKLHTEPFIVPKRFASNIRAPLANPTSTSNSFKLLPENSENILEANHVLTTESNTVKNTKTNNANTSDENTKSVPQIKRNSKDQNKTVTAIVGDSITKNIYS